MIDYEKAYEDTSNRIPYLPRHLVIGFQDYMKGKHSDDLYEDVGKYVDTTSYSPRTKNVYRNRLRRFLENLGEL